MKLPVLPLIFSWILLLTDLCLKAQPFDQQSIETVHGLIPIMIKSGDWNHDGNPDLILLHKDNASHYIGWYPNVKGQLSNQYQILYKVENQIVTFDIANLNDNAAPEIILMENEVTVLYNDGKGAVDRIEKVAFDGNLITGTGMDPLEGNYPDNPDHTILTVTDVDNDGDQDVLANQSGYPFVVQMVWYENIEGELQLKEWTLSDLGDSESQIHELIKAADINGDGNQDLFTALFTIRKNGKEDIFLNIHTNIVNTNQYYKFDDIQGFKDGVLADLNNDGAPDILGVSSDEPNQVFWYKNTSSRQRNFSNERKVIDTPSRPNTVLAADLDNDGDQDVMYASESTHTIAWYENLGNEKFSAAKSITTAATGVKSMCLGDFDVDGDEDIAFAGYDASNNREIVGWIENKILHVSSISTTSGTGGDQVTLVGMNFSKLLQENTVKMGETAVAVASVEQNGKELSFTVPVSLPQGTYPVTVSTSGQSITLDDPFTLQQSLNSFSPASGTGNTVFTLTGTNFYAPPGDNKVQLGATRIAVAKVNNENTALQAIIPVSLAAGTYEVAVNGQSFPDKEVFTILPNLLSFTPEAGKPGTSLIMTGTNLGNDQSKIKVQIGDTTAAIISLNAEGTLLKTTVPDLPEGKYVLSVTVNNQTVKAAKPFSMLEKDVELPEPAIASMAPIEGKPGELMTITGENFGTDKALVSVLFNETPANIISLEDSAITAIVPDLPTESYQVTVNVGDKTATFEQAFVIQENASPDPFITAITPDFGKPGEQIAIVGGNFGADTTSLSVQFGDTPADVVALADSTIWVAVPDLVLGSYVIAVVVGDTSLTALQTFLISEEASSSNPVVSSIYPLVAEAGETITIMGEHFGDNKNLISVMVNNMIATISSVNDSTIVFTMPALVQGTYEVEVVIGGKRISSVPTVTVNPTPDGDHTPPTLSFTFPNRYAAGSGELSMQVQATDASGIAKARFSLLQITEDAQKVPWRTKPIVQNNDMYTVTLSPEDFDELGIQYQFSFEDSAGNTKVTGVYYTYLQYPPNAAQKIIMQGISPVLDHTNPTVHDYHLIALPFESQPVHSIFKELGPQDDRFWKLFHYEEKQEETGTDREVYLKYPKTFSNFEPGKGYFFIYNKDTSLQVSGNVIEANTHKSFETLLAPGYNLIGNPYGYAINWNIVAETNPHLSNINLKTYNGKNGYENDQVLEAFEGGFVLNTSMQEVLLKIPVTAKQNAGGRYASGGSDNLLFEAPNWEMPLQLQTQHMTYNLGGIGMHADAKESIDPLDDFAPPHFLDYLEISFAHPEFQLAQVTRDVVSVQDNYIWEFQIHASLHGQEISMHWDHQWLTQIDDDRQLILHDLQNLQLIDMRKNNAYTFTSSAGTRDFNIYYGDYETIYKDLLSQEFIMGNPYPNPASDKVNIPLILPNTNQQYQVQLEIYNATGQRVYTTVDNVLMPGYHILQWSRNAVNTGIYVYRMHIEELGLVKEGRIVVQ